MNWTRTFKTLGTLGAIAASLSISATPAIANPERTFNPPNYQHEPLPETLDTANAWERVGRNAAATGDYHNAVVAFDKAIDLSRRRDPQLYELRGWAYYQQDETEAAIADLATAARLYFNRERYAAYRNAERMYDYVISRAEEDIVPSAPLAIER